MSYMVKKIQHKLARRFRLYQNLLTCRLQNNPLAELDKTLVTIFHDYEGKYARPDKEQESLSAVQKILELEKRYNIKGTYNTVAKLANDVPHIMKKIISDGHEVASHSYGHKLYTDMRKEEQKMEVIKSVQMFDNLDLNVRGHRSPQSAWTPTVVSELLKNKYDWIAETGPEPYPYVCTKNKVSRVWRFPVSGDDYFYESLNYTPEEMLQYWKDLVNDGIKSHKYIAIGLHPWVQADSTRLEVLSEFFSWLSELSDIEVLPFGQAVATFESAAQ